MSIGASPCSILAILSSTLVPPDLASAFFSLCARAAAIKLIASKKQPIAANLCPPSPFTMFPPQKLSTFAHPDPHRFPCHLQRRFPTHLGPLEPFFIFPSQRTLRQRFPIPSRSQ